MRNGRNVILMIATAILVFGWLFPALSGQYVDGGYYVFAFLIVCVWTILALVARKLVLWLVRSAKRKEISDG